MELQITFHAIERYALHHPDASVDSVRAAVARSLELAPAAALPLIGRNSTRPTHSRYFLAEDRRGLFVAEGEPGSAVVITYLRFGPWQAQLSERIWPPARGVEAAREAPSPQPSVRSLERAAERELACIGAPASTVVIGPAFKHALGSSGRARVALLSGTVLRSDFTEHLLRVGPLVVLLRYEHSRWRAELAPES